MTIDTQSDSKKRHVWLLSVYMCVCVLLCVVSEATHASGCHYQPVGEKVVSGEQFTGGKDGRVAQFYMWTTGPMRRVYEGGRFFYFQMPTEQMPCDGPNCRPSENNFSLQPSATTELPRLVLDGQFGSKCLFPPANSSPLLAWCRTDLSQPAPEDLLRPPRACIRCG